MCDMGALVQPYNPVKFNGGVRLSLLNTTKSDTGSLTFSDLGLNMSLRK